MANIKPCSFRQKPTGCIEVFCNGFRVGYIDLEHEDGDEWFFFPDKSGSIEAKPIAAVVLLEIATQLKRLNLDS